jgi:hypothetical protein
MAGEELTDILPICLIAAHEPTAMQEHHDWSVRCMLERPIDIEPLARIVPVGLIARDENTVAPLLLEQWSIDLLRQRQIEHRAAGANALRNVMRNSSAGRRH